jgi:F-type H+-transporting ATPase subunit b
MEINIAQIIFQIINFGVVFAALTYFLTKPITKMLDERSKKTEDAQKAAEETLREREQVDVMKKKAKSQAEKDADTLLEVAKGDVKELKAKLIREAKEEVATLKTKEMAKWESEKKGQMEAMEKEVSKLSIAIAAKILGAQVDEKTHKALISSSIKDLSKAI